MECPICYDVINEGEATSTPCGHTFHVTCMTSWLERATTCPSCRTRVAAAPTLTRITMEPGDRTLIFHEEQQLVVTAHFIMASACRILVARS